MRVPPCARCRGLFLAPGPLLALGDHVGLEEMFNIHECDLHLKGVCPEGN